MDNGQQRTTDRVHQALIDALKEAAAAPAPGEQRLYRSGKLPGIFPSRLGAAAQARDQALRDGLLEVVRTEVKGKTTIEWARITPRGIEFLHQHESPVRAMDELRAALAATQEGVPVWLADLRRQLQDLSVSLTEEVQAIARRLQSLTERVEEAMRRHNLSVPTGADVAGVVPWGPDAVTYLDRRRESGVVNSCPLPELFKALRESHPDLPVKDFHDGLRKLHDRSVVRLVPHDGTSDLPEPEYALLAGSAVYYHVTRT
jgi:hypothetical protein